MLFDWSAAFTTLLCVNLVACAIIAPPTAIVKAGEGKWSWVVISVLWLILTIFVTVGFAGGAA